MSFRLRIAILVSIVASALPCGAAVRDFLPDPQVPPRLVNDFASAFPSACADSLEAVLVDFDNRTSNQICVVTVTDLHDYDVARYALFLANKWGVGSKKNNGVLILLKTRMGGYVDVTIQVGRGLEGAIPDAYASRIIRNIMGPHLRNDEYWPAVSKACVELMALAEGEISEPRDSSEEFDPLTIAILIILLGLLIVVLGLIAKNHEGNSHNSGHRGNWGGGFGGGSGWGGFGGGSFGGGGFGGGGFGGFGGGSFGGGGASGRF